MACVVEMIPRTYAPSSPKPASTRKLTNKQKIVLTIVIVVVIVAVGVLTSLFA